jgi:uncharacterized membrane protein
MIKIISDPSIYMILVFILPSLLTAIIFPKQAKQIVDFIKIDFRSITIFFGACFLNFATYTYYSSLKAGGEVSNVGLIWQSSAVITIILSMAFLGERENWFRKIFGAVLVLSSVFLIK